MSCCSSLLKKYLMALTGAVLVGFVIVHMLGNLQMFCAPEAINTYAHRLHSLPPAVMWGSRVFLLICAVIHIWTGISLAIDNRAARGRHYEVNVSRSASSASKFGFLGNLYMPISGLVLLAFIPFHILHYTVRAAFTGIVGADYEKGGKFAATITTDHGPESVTNVYAMVADGFSHPAVAIFYIVAMVFLFAHLAHGLSSMFQSLGFRNEKWRPRLDIFAKVASTVLAIGFISIPVAVQAGLITRDGLKCNCGAAPAGEIVVVEVDTVTITPAAK